MASFRQLVVLLGLLGVCRAQFNVTCNPVNGSLHQFNSTDINGVAVNFSDYSGKVLLIANVASF